MFCFVFDKMNVLDIPSCENVILAYLVNFINEKVSLDLKHEVNLFGFVLGELKELELSLSR